LTRLWNAKPEPERMWVQTRGERFEARELEYGWRWRFRPVRGWRALKPVAWTVGEETEMWAAYHEWCRP